MKAKYYNLDEGIIKRIKEQEADVEQKGLEGLRKEEKYKKNKTENRISTKKKKNGNNKEKDKQKKKRQMI